MEQGPWFGAGRRRLSPRTNLGYDSMMEPSNPTMRTTTLSAAGGGRGVEGLGLGLGRVDLARMQA